MNSATPPPPLPTQSISPHNVVNASSSSSSASSTNASSTSHQLASLVAAAAAAAAASYGGGAGGGPTNMPSGHGMDATNGMSQLSHSAAALIKDKIQDLFEQAKRLEEEKRRRAEEEFQLQVRFLPPFLSCLFIWRQVRAHSKANLLANSI